MVPKDYTIFQVAKLLSSATNQHHQQQQQLEQPCNPYYYLTQDDLTECVLVSKTWHTAFIPLLWNTFADGTQTQWSIRLQEAVRGNVFEGQDVDWYLDVYRRHARFIRRLTVQHPLVLEALLKDGLRVPSSFLNKEKEKEHMSENMSEQCLSNESPVSSALSEESLVVGLDAVVPEVEQEVQEEQQEQEQEQEQEQQQEQVQQEKIIQEQQEKVEEEMSWATQLEHAEILIPWSTVRRFFRYRPIPGVKGTHSKEDQHISVLSDIEPDEEAADNNNNTSNDATGNDSNVPVLISISNTPTTTTTKTKTPTKCTTDDVISEAWWRLLLSNPNLQSLSLRQDLLHFRQLSQAHPSALGSIHTVFTQMFKGRLPILPPNVVKVDAVFWSSNGQYNREDEPGPVNQHMEEVTVKNVEHLGQLRQVFFQAPKLRRLIIRDLMLQDSLEVKSENEHRSLAVLEAEQRKEEELDELATVRSGVQVVKCENIRRRGKDSSSPLERLFRFTPKLVEFYNPYWTMEMASIFAEYCPLLEVVCIEESSSRQQANLARNAKQSFSDSISPLLTACSKLRVVDIRYECVDAKNVAEKPWVCLGLEELRCQFVGVPYLTEKEHKTVDRILAREEKEKNKNKKSTPDSDATTTSRSESEEELCERTKRAQEIRCQVFTQLSKLSRLKHLTLSPDLKNTNFYNADMYALIYRSKKDGLHYINYKDTQPDTLHLRLDCGLDQLATLTDLEYLAFESMDPMMRKEDIEWISKHFPRLKEMRGLALDTHVGVEEDLEKSALRELLQTLRPDILHTESL